MYKIKCLFEGQWRLDCTNRQYCSEYRRYEWIERKSQADQLAKLTRIQRNGGYVRK